MADSILAAEITLRDCGAKGSKEGLLRRFNAYGPSERFR